MGEPQRARKVSPRGTAAVNRAKRDAEALEMRTQGLSMREIGERLGVDHPQKVARMIDRAMSKAPQPNTKVLRDRALERLEITWRVVAEGMMREHHAVSFGKLVTETDPETGEQRPVRDWGPNYTAARIGVQVIERICKVIGADAPTKRQVEVITEDMLTVKIRELEAELGSLEDPDRSIRSNGSSSS